MVIIFFIFLNSYYLFVNSSTIKNKVNHPEIFRLQDEETFCNINIDITGCSPFKESRPRFSRYRQALFLASVFMTNCDLRIHPLKKVLMTWEIWITKNHEKKIKEMIHKTLFLMEEDSLEFGVYRLNLIVNVIFQSSNMKQKTRQKECFFEVVETGVQTIIHGGFIRSINFHSNIHFEVLTMLAPARPALCRTVEVSYVWRCYDHKRPNQSSAEQPPIFCKTFATSDTERLIKGPLTSAGLTPYLIDDLEIIKEYWFSLRTIIGHVYERNTESQVVFITDSPGVDIGIVCLLNCGGSSFKTNQQNIIHLEAKFNRSILKISSTTKITFLWSYQSKRDEEPNDIPMEARCNDTLTEDTELRIKSDFFRANSSYLVYVKSIIDGKTLQTSAIKIFTSSLPLDVKCTMSLENDTIAGIQFFDIFCACKDNHPTSVLFEFYNKNSSEEIGRHLGFSMTGVLENVVLTRRNLYVRVINLFGSSYEIQTEVILLNKIEPTLFNLAQEIDLVGLFGSQSIFLYDYQFRINLITAYWDILLSSKSVPSQFKFNKFNDLLIRFKYEYVTATDISGAIMINSVVSNILYIINSYSRRFLTSEGVLVLAQLIKKVSYVVREFTTNSKKTSRLITTHRVNNIAKDILQCSNFVLESKKNYNLLKSFNRNNLKISISYIIVALKNILKSVVSHQQLALNDLRMESKVIKFKVLRLKDEEKALKYHGNDDPFLKLAPFPKLHLNVITFKTNPFWWSNGYKINTDVKIVYLNEKHFKSIDKSFFSKTIPFELKIHGFTCMTVSGRVKQPSTNSSPETIENEIAVHRIETEVNSLTLINFTYIQNDANLRVVILKGLRPDYEYMTSSKLQDVTTNSSNIELRVEDVKEGEFLYIGILPGNKTKENEVIYYNFTVFTAGCRIWKYDMWVTSMGCFMGSKLSKDTLICICPLTSEIVGGHVSVPSHLFNPFSEMSLFISEKDYPLVVIILVIICLLYLILLIWIRKMSVKDRQKFNIIVLEDNVPHDSFVYLVGVFTGARLEAGTTSNVGFKLLGEDGLSRSHILNCLECPVLKCNSENWFLLASPHHLGSITSILLWIDYSGKKPNWYCSKIQVFDMVSQDNDFFFVESWLGITAQEICLETFAECATYRETNKTSRIISENLLYGFMEGHYLASVFFKHPRSPVTRTQRLTAVFCGILVNITVCILLCYPTSPQSVDFSSYTITKGTIIIGMIGSLVECVVSLIIIHSFYTSHTDSDSPARFRTSEGCRDIYHFQRNVSYEMNNAPKWLKILQSLIKIHMKPVKSLPLQSEKEILVGINFKKNKIKIIMFLCIFIMIICCHFIILFGLPFGKIKMFVLFTCILFSTFLTNFMIIPIKILITAILLGCTKTRYYELMTFSLDVGKILHNLSQKTRNYRRFLIRLRNMEMYTPTSHIKSKKLQHEYHRFVCKLTICYVTGCLIFLCVIIWLVQLFKIRLFFLTSMVATCSQFGSHDLCQTIYRYDLENVTEFWDSLPKKTFKVMYRKKWYNGREMSLPQEMFHESGWLKSGDWRLVGFPRLRQFRVKPFDSTNCSVPTVMANISRKCHVGLSKDTEDNADYGMRWSNDVSNWDVELFYSSPWEYTEPSLELGDFLRGTSGYLYHSGGYVANLHWTWTKTQGRLSSLLDTNWIDEYTRAMIVDFTIYNANKNIYTVTNIIMEILAVGNVKVVYYFRSTSLLPFVESGVLFSLMFMFFILQLIYIINITGAEKFLSNLWNLYECLILIVFVYATLLYCRWILRVSDAREKLTKHQTNVSISIENIIEFSDHTKKALGLLFSLMLFRFLRTIRFNKDVKTYAQDLLEARTEVFFGCLITAMLMFVQFRLIMFLTTSPSAYNLKDVLIFRSQFKNIVRLQYHQTAGKVLAFMLNFTSQLGVFTLMLSQYHHFKKAQAKTLERKKERAEFLIGVLGK